MLLLAQSSFFAELWRKLIDPIGVLGVAGQTVFAGRMIVQWWASEKRGQSVVPKLFWHMSLWGSVLVLIYGVADRDPVVLIGQVPGFVVYLRNLVLLSRSGRAESLNTESIGLSTSSQSNCPQVVTTISSPTIDPLDSP